MNLLQHFELAVIL